SMQATKSALASGGMTHCFLRCGLRMFFLESARWCCRWPSRRSKFDDLLLQQTQRPMRAPVRRLRAGDGDQLRLRVAVEDFRARARRIVLPRQHGLEPLLDQALAGARDIVETGLQRL